MRIRSWLLLIAGALLAGAGYGLFIVPARLAPGGVSGIAALLHAFLPVPAGLCIFLLNIPLFLVSWRHLGRLFGIRSFVGMCLLSLFADLFTFSTPVKDEPLLCAVFGGVLTGAGLALCFLAGGSTGGVDIIGKLLNSRHPETSVGTVLLCTDAVVVVAGTVLNGLLCGLYSLICVFVSSRVLDFLLDGSRSAKVYCIVTHRGEELTKEILSGIHRGVTLLDVRGGYTGTESSLLLCLVQRPDIVPMRRLLQAQDPDAFVFVLPAAEVMGEGFRN